MMRALLSLVLITTLTMSPLMAQNAPASKLKLDTAGGHFDNALLGNSILMALPSKSPAAGMPAAPRNGDAPGKNKSIIIGLLILAGATTAIIMLWPNGHDKPAPVAAPVTPVLTGTILAAGTPSVNTSNQ
jgi:hypothetical protein